MADGTIEIGIELSDEGVSKDAERIGEETGEKTKKGIEKGLDGVEKDAEKVGKDAGEALSEGVEEGAKGASDAAKSGLSGVKGSAGSEGKAAGDALGSGLEAGAKSGAAGAASAVKGETGGVKSTAKADGKSAGSAFGDSFNSAVSASLGKLKDTLKGATGAAAAALSFGALTGKASELVEVANDVQEDMGKLSVAFTQQGYSAETAQAAYRDFVGVLGETDQSVEAVNHLAQLTKSEDELAEWTDIAAGVYATFGDSLPLEGLTEAANETAKVGQVTGPLADALNWASGGAESMAVAFEGNSKALGAYNSAIESGASVEDAFNEALLQVSDESERSTIITKAMAAAYSEAGQAYNDANDSLIAYRQAQSDLNVAMAQAGTLLMPFSTAITSATIPALNVLTEALGEVMPAFNEAFSAGNLTQAASAVGEGITEIIGGMIGLLPEFISSGVELIGGLAIGIVQGLPDLVADVVEAVAEAVPMITESLFEVAAGIVEALPEIIESIAEAIPDMIVSIVEMISEQGETLVEGFITLFNAVIEALPEIIEALVMMIPTIISTLVTSLSENSQSLIDGFVQLFMAVVQSLPEIIAAIVPMIPQIVVSLVQALVENMPALIMGFIQLFMAFVQALPQIIATIVQMIPQIVSSIVNGLIPLGAQLSSSAREAFGNFINGISEKVPSILSNVASIPGKIIDKIKSGLSGIGSVGSNLVHGIWGGISGAAGWLMGKISGFANSVMSNIKGFFGIHSPSTRMRDEVGTYLAEGVWVGWEKEDALGQIEGSLRSFTVDQTAKIGIASESAYNDSAVVGQLNTLIDAVRSGRVVKMSTGELVGATANAYNSMFGKMAAVESRGF